METEGDLRLLANERRGGTFSDCLGAAVAGADAGGGGAGGASFLTPAASDSGVAAVLAAAAAAEEEEEAADGVACGWKVRCGFSRCAKVPKAKRLVHSGNLLRATCKRATANQRRRQTNLT